MNQLATIKKIEQAKITIAKVKTLDEIKILLDQSEAFKAYARSAQLSAEMQADIAELNIRATRRLGEISDALEKSKGGRPRKNCCTAGNSFFDKTKTEVLAENGIDLRKAIRAERIAKIPEVVFEEKIALAKETSEKITKAIFDKPMASIPVFTQAEIDDDEASLKRVKKYIKTGVKPQNWHSDTDNKLMEFVKKHDKKVKDHCKELAKKKEVKNEVNDDSFLVIFADHVKGLKGDNLKIAICQAMIKMCKNIIGGIEAKKSRKAA